MPTWAAILVAVAGSGTLSAIVAYLLQRKFNLAIADKAHTEAEHAIDEALEQARAQTKVWYDRWKEEADARIADREMFINEIAGLTAELALIKARMAKWEAQMKTNGIVPTNGS